jgi:hypothetical protein
MSDIANPIKSDEDWVSFKDAQFLTTIFLASSVYIVLAIPNQLEDIGLRF